ncbi:MAG: hypothetical protein ACSLE1_15820 [Sphingobium sp.]
MADDPKWKSKQQQAREADVTVTSLRRLKQPPDQVWIVSQDADDRRRQLGNHGLLIGIIGDRSFTKAGVKNFVDHDHRGMLRLRLHISNSDQSVLGRAITIYPDLVGNGLVEQSYLVSGNPNFYRRWQAFHSVTHRVFMVRPAAVKAFWTGFLPRLNSTWIALMSDPESKSSTIFAFLS